jgi:hypothetical protein
MAKQYYLTSNLLRKRGACSNGCSLFRKTFGVLSNEQVLFTPENIEKAIRAGLPLNWVVWRIWPYGHRAGPLRWEAFDILNKVKNSRARRAKTLYNYVNRYHPNQ